MKYECQECKSTFQHIECNVCEHKFYPKQDPIIMEIIESLKDAMKIFNEFKMSGGRIDHIKETLVKVENIQEMEFTAKYNADMCNQMEARAKEAELKVEQLQKTLNTTQDICTLPENSPNGCVMQDKTTVKYCGCKSTECAYRVKKNKS